MTDISQLHIVVKSFKICVLTNIVGVINSRRMTGGTCSTNEGTINFFKKLQMRNHLGNLGIDGR
jgi:hypothetical protein